MALTVTITDTTAPALTLPANMTLERLTLVPVDGFGNPTSDGSATYVFDYKMSFVYNYLATATLHSTGVGLEENASRDIAGVLPSGSSGSSGSSWPRPAWCSWWPCGSPPRRSSGV